MITFTRIGIAFFTLAVVLGPLYTVAEYSVVTNLISELGAQHTQNNFIMIIAFAILGAGIIIDGMRTFRFALLPFILFGVAMAAVGMFPHKPIDTSLNFNSAYHNIHGIIASVAGTVITVGFIWQGLRSSGRHRMVCFYMALVAIVYPILMLNIPNFQGFIQRLMYLQILGWIWMKYPKLLVATQRKNLLDVLFADSPVNNRIKPTQEEYIELMPMGDETGLILGTDIAITKICLSQIPLRLILLASLQIPVNIT